jgi:hypothetical protein
MSFWQTAWVVVVDGLLALNALGAYAAYTSPERDPEDGVFLVVFAALIGLSIPIFTLT